MSMGNPVTLLLVEDDDLDVMGIERGFNKLKLGNPMVRAVDGQDAIDRIRGLNGYDPLPRPFLVLLDLNMPRMNGIEFIQTIREDPDLRRTIIFVLTTSALEEDKVRAYDRNVAGYILKKDPSTSFMDALGLIDCYWTLVELP